MKKKTVLFLFLLSALAGLTSCGSSSSGKKCDGGTCTIGYRIQAENNKPDIVIR